MKNKPENNTLVYSGMIASKPRMTQSDKWKVRPATSKYWAFKDLLTIAAKQQGFTLGERVIITVDIQMPRSWSAKKRETMCRMPHKQKPDASNILKAIEDILLPDDDSGIWDIHITKHWSNNESMVIIKNLV